jgi:hypothetical protein
MVTTNVLWQSGLAEDFGRLSEARNEASLCATDEMLGMDFLFWAKLDNVCIYS